MSVASTLTTWIKDDIKESGTGRDGELLRYMNRVIQKAIVPTLIRFQSTIGITEWNSDEVTENVREVAMPTGCLAIRDLYCIDSEEDGTAQAGTNTTITLASDASSSDDAYNSRQVRIYGGTGDGQQKIITDYVGSTTVATVNSAWTTNPDSTSTYIVFKEPSRSNRLKQREPDWVRENHSSTGKPQYFGIDDTNIVLGNIPDSTVRVLWGWYYKYPTSLTATTDTVPYNGIFDHVITEYTTMRALNRDEYNTNIEQGLLSEAIDGISGILAVRRSRTDRQPRLAGSEDD